jgi:hypothetical protein
VRTPRGEPAVSRFDPTRLQRLADLGGGSFAGADDGSAVAAIAASLGSRSGGPSSSSSPASDGVDLGLLMSLGALAFLLLEGLLEARERWLSSSMFPAEA